MTMTRAIMLVCGAGAIALGVAQCVDSTTPNEPPKRKAACFIRMPDGHGLPIYDAEQCGPNTWTPKGE